MSASSSPDHLVLSLHDPGMTPLHRAGLGGLAATLRALHREIRASRHPADKAPGHPWPADMPWHGSEDPAAPWHVTPRAITLRFGQPHLASDYFTRLFKFAFQTRNGFIHLPGQYHDTPPPAPVLAELQTALCCTFLQHGLTRKMGAAVTVQYDTGEAVPTASYSYKPCTSYKHQDDWRDKLAHVKGKPGGVLNSEPSVIEGPLYPGATQRHVVHAKTKIQQTPSALLPLYFALVGTLSLSIRGHTGILLIPEPADLLAYAALRPHLTPATLRQCQIANAADATLQTYVRLRATELLRESDLPACHTITLRSTPWATQQKSRVATLDITPQDDSAALARFEIALAHLPPRLKATDDGTAFWADSLVRPLIADNLANHRPWYQGFTRFMVAYDEGKPRRPLRDKIKYETKNLYLMTTAPDSPLWNQPGEATLVHAVHTALRQRYGQIAETAKGKSAMSNRFAREYERWRIAFATAKTCDQFRTALCDLFSRAGGNAILREHWQTLLPLLRDDHWQLTRDLALLALASYASSKEPNETKPANNPAPEQD